MLALALACLALYDVLSEAVDIRYVATGSMEPSIPRGSIVVIYRNPVDISVGDVVAYRYPQSPNILLLHRVVWVNGTHVYVKGDAVDTVEMVNRENVLGVYLWGIPSVMLVVSYLLSDPLLLYTLVASIALCYLLSSRGSRNDGIDRYSGN